jgi:hypothetical protein
MRYSKSQSLKIWIACAVGSLAMGQFPIATANPKPMQQPQQGVQQPIRSTTPNRTNELNNRQANPTTPPAGANPDARPTQSDGTNQTNPVDRRIQDGQNNQMRIELDPTEQGEPMNQTTPPAGTNPDTRPTQSDGTNQTNPVDRRIQNDPNINPSDRMDRDK